VVDGDVEKSIEMYYRMIGAMPGDSNDSQGAADEGTLGFGSVGLEGIQGNTISQSDEFTVAASLNIPREMAGFTVYCAIEDMYGRWICRQRMDSSDLRLRNVGPGRYEIRVRFPPLWLNPGLYSIGFKAHFWTGCDSPEAASDKFPLDVSGTKGDSDSVLQPEVAWSVESELSRTKFRPR